VTPSIILDYILPPLEEGLFLIARKNEKNYRKNYLNVIA
jgi:hypothetical protein